MIVLEYLLYFVAILFLIYVATRMATTAFFASLEDHYRRLTKWQQEEDSEKDLAEVVEESEKD